MAHHYKLSPVDLVPPMAVVELTRMAETGKHRFAECWLLEDGMWRLDCETGKFYRRVWVDEPDEAE